MAGKAEMEVLRASHIQKVEDSTIHLGKLILEASNRMNDVFHRTEQLSDAQFLLKLFAQKVEEHNTKCRQKAAQMRNVKR